MKKKNKKVVKVEHAIRRITIIAILLAAIIFLITVAPNYVKEANSDKINLIINNNNITGRLKNDIVVENGIPYLSTADFKIFFDEFLIEDNNSIITTSNTKTVKISTETNTMNINGANEKLQNNICKRNSNYYLPIKEMASVYNYEYDYKNGIVIIDSLNKKFVQATSSKNQEVKFKATTFSKAIEKVKRGDILTIVQDTHKNVDSEVNGYLRVRTQNGNMGYIKQTNIIGRNVVRDNLDENTILGKVRLAFDYYNQYTKAPSRTTSIDGINAVSPSFYELKSDGSLVKNVDQNYIDWAHGNGYKIWPTLSNSSLNNLDAVSRMMQTFESRQKLIDNIVKALVESEVDGINVDFENMYKEDKDKYSRFLIELRPRIKEIGMTMCVDVTEPDGSDTWSLCYDRHTIGKVADYVIFIGYDQHTAGSTTAGSVASANWVELNITKFLGQEGIPKEKLILSMPFYTRLWKEQNGKLTSSVVNMNKVTIPKGVEKVWNEEAKQNYIEYKQGSATYKMWIEDEQSISAKIDLVNKYDLAGGSFWEIDRETVGVWKIINEKM